MFFLTTTTEYATFDLRAEDRVTVELFAPVMTGRLLAGDSPLELIESYTAYAGRMRRLPDWILSGAVVGVQGGTARVPEVRERLAARASRWRRTGCKTGWASAPPASASSSGGTGSWPSAEGLLERG